MTSHLDIEAGGQPMVLPDDFQIDITEKNPVFNDTEMYSTPAEVPTEGNGHVLRNIGDAQSSLRPVSLEHTPMRIIADGLPFRSGVMAIQEDSEVGDRFAFNIDESTQSLQDLIGDLQCRDVPLYNNELLPIGQKVCNVSISGTVSRHIYFALEDGGDANDREVDADEPFTQEFEPSLLGFSYPGIVRRAASAARRRKSYPNGMEVRVPEVTQSFINVSEPYESVNGTPTGWRYCNARVCYTHYKLDEDARTDNEEIDGVTYKGTIGETKDEINDDYSNFGSNEDYGPYWVLDAERPGSGICFYVLYFLDSLFSYLGVSFDNSALTAIEDLRRLCFFQTRCKYMTLPDADEAPVETLTSLAAINDWATERGCGGTIEIRPVLEKQSVQQARAKVDGESKIWHVGDMMRTAYSSIWDITTEKKIVRIDASGTVSVASAQAKVRTMYATSENFPDASVKQVLDSLEASFGIRFRYDHQRRHVTAYLLRDVLRQKDAQGRQLPPVVLPCEVLSVSKLSEKITGVRMKYSAESDSKEQQQNVRQAKRDYETDFDYIDYREGRTQVVDGYMNVIASRRTENVTCYVDRLTGNAFRWKISKDLTTSANVMYHRLFEVGQFKGLEVGDCSPQNEDFVRELVSDFQPMSWNDVNYYAYGVKPGEQRSILAAFVDEDMEHEFVTQKLAYPLYTEDVEAYANEVLQLVESYDPTGTDEGDSPLQDADWGLAIAIMRGGGSDATIENYARGYDGFDNSKWRQTAGESAMASDSMDMFGGTFDYNGQQAGDGGGERFSLKIRAWKPFLYYIDAAGQTHVTADTSLLGQPVAEGSSLTWLRPCRADETDPQTGLIANRIASRGLADVFMAEFIHFLLHRRKLRIHLLAETAALLDVPRHWDRRFDIGGIVGYIDQMQYSISRADGVGEVTIDLFAI